MKLEYKSDGGYSGDAALGVVVLSTDETLEPEMRQITSQSGAKLYHTRIPFATNVTPENLAMMEHDLPTSISLMPPKIDFKAIGYACTSGATVIGSNKLAQIIQKIYPNAAVTDPIKAVIAACVALGVKRLGMLTPYRADVSAAMRELLEKNDIEITSFGSFEEESDHKVARISQSSTLDGMMHVGAKNCDAVFSSCTNLGSFDVIEKAEKALGKPVISSNSAFTWHLHRLAGFTGPIAGPGQLFTV